MTDPRTRIISLQQRIASLKAQRKSTEAVVHELKMEMTRQLNRENRQDKKRKAA